MTTITGNTFKVKDQLRKLGGRWDGKNWVVPDDKADAAWALVGGKPTPAPAPIVRGKATLRRLSRPNSIDGAVARLEVDYGPIQHGGVARYGVQSAEAVAEFVRVADPANEDFGGERDFDAWVHYVFTHRDDVKHDYS
jgi:hypothetical protein